MPALRGHHLICLHFFNGEGYDPDFIENLHDVLKKAEYEDVSIPPEADDVCNKCPHLKEERCRYKEEADKEIKEMDEKALDLLKASKDTKVKWQEIRNRIPGIFEAWYKAYCNACGWKRACEKNASYRRLRISINDS